MCTSDLLMPKKINKSSSCVLDMFASRGLVYFQNRRGPPETADKQELYTNIYVYSSSYPVASMHCIGLQLAFASYISGGSAVLCGDNPC